MNGGLKTTRRRRQTEITTTRFSRCHWLTIKIQWALHQTSK